MLHYSKVLTHFSLSFIKLAVSIPFLCAFGDSFSLAPSDDDPAQKVQIVEMHKKSKCHNISSSWAASPFLTATFSLKFNPPASIWWICWNGRVRIWILAGNLTARLGCDFQWEETQLHHLHHCLNLRHLFVQPVLYHIEILGFQLSWLASILCRDKRTIIQIANPMESCRIMARIRILMQ